MKRSADTQLTRDTADLDDSSEDAPGPWKKADESVLAGRQIRALPKRRGLSALSSTSATPTDGSPRVPSFSAFGAAPASKDSTTSNPSSGFSFGPFSVKGTGGADTTSKPSIFTGFGSSASSEPIAAATADTTKTPTPTPFSFSAPKSSGTSFGAKPTTTAPSFTFPPASALASKPAAAPSNPSISSNAPKPSLGSEPKVTTQAETKDTHALKYYTSLRGLNTSFIKELQRMQSADAFVDFAGVFESYGKNRRSIVDEFEKMKISSGSKSGDAESSSKTTTTTKSDSTVPPTTAATTTFASASTSVPKLPVAPSGGFTFGGKTVTAPPISSNGSTTAPTSFSFGGKIVGSGSSTPAATSFGAGSTTNLFGSNTKKDGGETNSDASSTAPKPFGGFTFGAAATSKPADSKDTSGSTSSAPTTSPFTFGSTKPSTTGFTFGTSSSGSTTTAGGFTFGAGFGTKPPEPIKNMSSTTSAPGGFVWGKPAPGSDAKPPTFSGFGKLPTTLSSSETPADGSASGDAVGGAGGDGAEPMVSKELRYDIEGPGEEDEETIKSAKCKVYRLGTEDGKESGDKKWLDLGIGYLRLKKHKTTGAKRVLCRNATTGKVLINFGFFASLSPTVDDKTIAFLGVLEDGKTPAPFRLRVKTKEDAEAFVAAWKEMIAS